MPAKKLFWDDPYRTELDTTVTEVRENVVTLRETIFFAFSGGQESDRGTIGGHEVLDARKIGTEIFYTLPAGHRLKASDLVKVEIDGPHRLALMRLHFAAELVLWTMLARHGAPEKIGAHISPDKARIDFLWEGSIAPVLPDVADCVNRLIEENLPIESAFSDEAAERRFWRIDGVGEMACGGTHPKRTGEIGPVRLRRRNIGSGRERIEITLEAP